MNIAEGDSCTGFRIGGLPPVGVKPRSINEFTHYFGTFPITGHRDEEMSLFYSFVYLDSQDPRSITNHIGKLIGCESEVLQCVFHKRSPRAKRSRLASELSGYAVRIGNEMTDDPDDKSSGMPHKIGGVSFLQHEASAVRKISDDLICSGYIHLLQWGYPGANDCRVKGQWAFHNYMLHFYLKQTTEGYEHKAILT